MLNEGLTEIKNKGNELLIKSIEVNKNKSIPQSSTYYQTLWFFQ